MRSQVHTARGGFRDSLPYGVKYNSNFQPFVRKRDVSDGDDDSLTREPEMVRAYRDTWELGLHSYLTYLRNRFLVARELLSERGSIFVQTNDERIHHVREVLEEVFGEENFVSDIAYVTTSGRASSTLDNVADRLLWYAKDRAHLKYVPLWRPRSEKTLSEQYTMLDVLGGSPRRMTKRELLGADLLPQGARRFMPDNISSTGASEAGSTPFTFEGRTYTLPANTHWKTTAQGMERLAAASRLFPIGSRLRYKRFADDFPFVPFTNVWDDTVISGFSAEKLYVVQTNTKVIERCLLMTTEPGDLVLDPTCGSGTTAYVAERWGRRWITVDVSRVPVALARQRLLTATYPYYELQDPARGPSGGFVYRRRQNPKGEEVGGIVPRITLDSIAKDEPPTEEVLPDRPEAQSRVTRVTGPFCVEATIPTTLDERGMAGSSSRDNDSDRFADRLVDVLRRNPVLQLSRRETLTLDNVRRPAKALTISAEASLGRDGARVALVVGPENAAVSERLVYEGAREAHARSFDRLLVIGLAIESAARELVDRCDDLVDIPATYVQATPDLVMGDLLKTMRSSQIFSVTGLPDVAVVHLAADEPGGPSRWQVELRGLDVFDPVSMQVAHRSGDDVPAWLLDTDYNGMCFHVSQAFFPRTSAWDSLKSALRGEFEDAVWEHLAGTTSAPFVAGESGKVAVKVIDDRGNELLVVKDLEVEDPR